MCNLFQTDIIRADGFNNSSAFIMTLGDKMITANEYFRKIFGCKVYRLTLSGGTTCPNRDGTCGEGGCIFCAEGSGSFASYNSNFDTQIENAIMRVKDKCKSGKYIAYFQSFTSTYKNIDYLYERIENCLNRNEIVGISVATRPDCLPQEVINKLAEYNKIKPVFIELGLQTSNDETAILINRGYKTEIYIDAAKRLHNANLKIIAHVIIGLPNENERILLDTVNLVCKTADGIKLQLLHVLRGTKLYEMYKKEQYKPLEFNEYIDLLKKAVSIIPNDFPVYRLTGDGDKKLLVAPLWSSDKKRVLNELKKHIDI